ncbi:MAG TPA: hypothetical protein VGL34_18380 [Steroidobacteraceae bacterium]
MNQPIKFPDMRPPKDRAASIDLPTPAGYRQRVPLFPTSDASHKNRRVERKRLVFWFGLAVALHAALLLGLWLTPPLRLKWGPSSDAWVQVMSLPKKEPEVPILDVPEASKAAPTKAKSRKAQTAVQPSHEESQ